MIQALGSNNRFFHLRALYEDDDRLAVYTDILGDPGSSQGPPFEYLGPTILRTLYSSDVFYPRYGGPFWSEGTINPIDEPRWSRGYSLEYFKDSTGEWGSPYYRNELLSVPQQKLPEIKLYPNPASGHITIEGLNRTCDFIILNVQGQLVLKGKLNENDPSISTSELADGVYFLKLKSEGMLRRVKFIVRH